MSTFNIPQALPQPATRYPFRPGDAVFYLPHPGGFCNKQQLIPTIVVKAQPALVATRKAAPRVSILRAGAQRSSSVEGRNLAYRGFCGFCGVPAVLGRDDTLVCPRCAEPATAVPPPNELTLRWYPIGDAGGAQIARISFLTGCTWGDALHERNQRHYGAFDALAQKHGMMDEMYQRLGPWTEEGGRFFWFSDAMHWYAELDDEESFLAYYRTHADDGLLPTERTSKFVSFFQAMLDGDGPGGPSRRMVLPPLDIVRIADDSEPDGACEITRWLERQFGRAA